MKRLALVLVLLGLTFPAGGEGAEYKRGNKSCTDKSEEYYRLDSEDPDNQYLYASCLVIKGNDNEVAGLVSPYPRDAEWVERAAELYAEGLTLAEVGSGGVPATSPPGRPGAASRSSG